MSQAAAQTIAQDPCNKQHGSAGGRSTGRSKGSQRKRTSSPLDKRLRAARMGAAARRALRRPRRLQIMAAEMNAKGQAVSGSKDDEDQQPVAKMSKSGRGWGGDVARGRLTADQLAAAADPVR